MDGGYCGLVGRAVPLVNLAIFHKLPGGRRKPFTPVTLAHVFNSGIHAEVATTNAVGTCHELITCIL